MLPVAFETLKELVDLARHSASAANFQPAEVCAFMRPRKECHDFFTPVLGGIS